MSVFFWTPETFWNSTPIEFRAAVDAHNKAHQEDKPTRKEKEERYQHLLDIAAMERAEIEKRKRGG